jgi:hypothetical protein
LGFGEVGEGCLRFLMGRCGQMQEEEDDKYCESADGEVDVEAPAPR